MCPSESAVGPMWVPRDDWGHPEHSILGANRICHHRSNLLRRGQRVHSIAFLCHLCPILLGRPATRRSHILVAVEALVFDFAAAFCFWTEQVLYPLGRSQPINTFMKVLQRDHWNLCRHDATLPYPG